MNQVDRIIEFAATLPDPKERERGRAAALRYSTLPSLAAGLGLVGVATTSKGTPWDRRDKKIRAALHESGHAEGYRVHSDVHGGPIMGRLMPGAANPGTKYAGDIPPKTAFITENVRPYFKPGVLAHEIGHTRDKFLNTKAGRIGYGIGSLAPQAGTLGTAITKDQTRAKKYAVASTVASAPMLAAEIQASISGIKALRKGGIKGLRSLTPAVGLPSYAGLAAGPAIAYQVKKRHHGYTETPK